MEVEWKIDRDRDRGRRKGRDMNKVGSRVEG